MLAAALLAFAACRKPKPSPAYTEASGAYTTLLAKLGDDAYADDEMTRIEGLLASVPGDSLDAQAAAELKAKINAERTRVAQEAAEHERAMASALAPTSPDPAPRGAEAPSAAAGEPDAGASSDFRAGMTLDELRKVSGGCFTSAGPLTLRNPDGSEAPAEMFERLDSTLCNTRYAKYGERFLVFRDGKLAGDFPRSSLTQIKIGGGSAGGAGQAPAAPSPSPQPAAPAPPPVVEPGGDRPPTPMPPPESPGEQTGSAPP